MNTQALRRRWAALLTVLVGVGVAHASILDAQTTVKIKVGATSKSVQGQSVSQNCSTTHRTSHPRVIVVYSYPVYYSYPYYNSYGMVSYSNSRIRYPSDTVSSYSSNSDTADKSKAYAISYEDEYYKLGRDWGQDLRRDVVKFDEFVVFVHKKIVAAPESLRFQFRRGFENGYGQHAEEALAKAFASTEGAQSSAETGKTRVY